MTQINNHFNNKFLKIKQFITVCVMRGCEHVSITAWTWRSKEDFVKSVFSFHHVGYRDQTQDFSLRSKDLFSLSHLLSLRYLREWQVGAWYLNHMPHCSDFSYWISWFYGMSVEFLWMQWSNWKGENYKDCFMVKF